MTTELVKELTGEEALTLNGGGCAAIGALIAVFALTENWAGVAGGILTAYHYGCFDSW
jgi:hypothetical protein